MHPVVRVTADWAALKNYPGYTRVFLNIYARARQMIMILVAETVHRRNSAFQESVEKTNAYFFVEVVTQGK